MLDTQQYLKCREPALAKLRDKVERILKTAQDEVDELLEEWITENFIEPGRKAIDSAISDGELAEEETREREGEISELEEKVTDLELEITELKAQLAELQP